ncbi:hypothetical protein HDF22_005301 [Mucilaginibacter lappiensis]|nr:hypothetical protein [Mucilaginibacter lappiensis]
MERPDIFNRLKSGELIRLSDPEFPKIDEIVNHTIRLSARLNSTGDIQ